jgi:hypothetical protein
MAMRAQLVGVCALCALATPAHADERRKVAVIDLSGDPEAKDLRNALYGELIRHWALQPLETEGLNDALQGDFLDEDHAGLERARAKRADADAAIGRFDAAAAATAAQDGEHALVEVAPTAAAGACADLAFVAGAAELDQHRANEASVAFAFVRRLDPARKPDPVRYPPEIIAAYAAAAAIRPAKAHLDVRGPGRVWIDGVDRGTAGAFEVDVGLHLVQLVGPGLVTAGQVVRIERDQSVDIAAPPASLELQVRRARRELAQLPDDAVARAGAMKQLADLLQVHDAVLIWKRKGDGRLLVQTWRDRAPGFSALREHATEPAGEVLEPLSPPKPPEPDSDVKPPPFTPPVHGEDEPRWYQKRWVQASVAGGVVVGVVGAILWARRSRNVTLNNNPQFITEPPP